MSEDMVTDAAVEADASNADLSNYVPKNEVNDLVRNAQGRAAAKAREEAKREYEAQIQNLESIRQSQQAAQSMAQTQEQRNQQVDRNVDVDAMYQQIQERFNRDMQEKQAEAELARVANTFAQQMDQGAQSYEDWNEVVGDFEPQAFPHVVYLTAGLPNGADVVYYLSQNPEKLVAMNSLAERSPRMAQAQLQGIAGTLQQNKTAKEEAYGEQPPLDRLQPSRVSGSNGKMTIRDLKNQDWLRG